MRTIKHTRERESHYRFGDVEFPEGEREIEVDDETAEWAVGRDDVEYADEEGGDDEDDEETVEIEETEDEDEE